ncbi:hypothetical protein ACWCPQ_17710 [Nocardia sp. NPDC001965]|nr:hypothetical protein [Nocardia sp.]NUS91440.1 hypothetical protein [Nocardia sp.]
MAETIRLLHDDYRTDTETLRRVATAIRALPGRTRQPTADDIARLRGEFDRVIARLRAADHLELDRGR